MFAHSSIHPSIGPPLNTPPPTERASKFFPRINFKEIKSTRCQQPGRVSVTHKSAPIKGRHHLFWIIALLSKAAAAQCLKSYWICFCKNTEERVLGTLTGGSLDGFDWQMSSSYFFSQQIRNHTSCRKPGWNSNSYEPWHHF